MKIVNCIGLFLIIALTMLISGYLAFAENNAWIFFLFAGCLFFILTIGYCNSPMVKSEELPDAEEAA